jgi:pilus assembly protein CpaC
MASALALALGSFAATRSLAQAVASPNSVIHKISNLSEKLELTTNSSRILTLERPIPRVQVNNPELVAVTPLSATQVQISAKKAGVTQVNLWDEDGSIHTVDVQIYGDARELQLALATQFPHASIKVFRYSESLVLTGYVDRPDHISPIMALAQDYAPKVINNINVGGVQQILLKTKVMEMSRTKLRRLGSDFIVGGGNGGFFSTGVSGLITDTTNNIGAFQSVADTTGNAARFGIVHNNSAFFGFIDWAQENRIAKILAEPNIVAVSGRPAQFNVGGEIPIVVPQSLGTASIEFKPFGTQIDFLPIVLGNGNIRLEVRPRISEIDDSRSVIIQNFTIPSLTVRQVDTAVEMKAGQTFALAGLVQERSETVKRGLPYISDVPVLGVPFRKVEDDTNEIELLIIVTPEFVDPIDACEYQCGGPGTFTTQPRTNELYCGGKIEVPVHCNPHQGLAAQFCDDCNGNCGAGGCAGCNNGNGTVIVNGQPMQANPPVQLPGGTGYDDAPGVPAIGPAYKVQGDPQPAVLPEIGPAEAPASAPTPTPAPALPPQSGAQNLPEDFSLPVVTDRPIVESPTATMQQAPMQPQALPATGTQQPAATLPTAPMPSTSTYYGPASGPTQMAPIASPAGQGVAPSYTGPRPYSPQRQPVFMRNATKPYNPQSSRAATAAPQSGNGLFGPVGYDVE